MMKSFPCTAAFYKIAVGGEGAVTVTNDRYNVTTVPMIGVFYYMRITGANAADPINSVWVDTLSVSQSTWSPSFSGGSCSVASCLGINVLSVVNSNNPTITVSGTGWTKTRQDANPNTDMVATLSTKPMNAVGNQANISYSSSIANGDWGAMTLAINPATVVHPTYPVIANYSQHMSAADARTTTHSISPPSGIIAGDLLIIFVNTDSTGAAEETALTSPSGWTKLREAGDTASDVHVAVFWKIAVGGETAVSFSHTNCIHLTWWLRVTGATAIDVSAEYQSPATDTPHGVLTALWPTTTGANRLLIGSSALSTGQIGAEFVYGAGDLTLVAAVTNSDTINNLYAALFTGRAPVAGINAGASIFHSSARHPGVGSHTHAAVALAVY
jgi:hypothetical protein